MSILLHIKKGFQLGGVHSPTSFLDPKSTPRATSNSLFPKSKFNFGYPVLEQNRKMKSNLWHILPNFEQNENFQ